MKIATWNLERLKNKQNIPQILSYLKKLDADILILTETNECIDLGTNYNVSHTEKLEGGFYKQGDRQVSIFSKYPVIRQILTFRADTSVCSAINTPFGELIVYGTIIGNFGNRNNEFKPDLEKQLADFAAIGKTSNFCIAGDFNISFSDNFYFTKEGRNKLTDLFEQIGMKITTEHITQNIDHILLTKKFTTNKDIINGYWNDIEDETTRLSDHKGVFIEIFEDVKYS